MIVQDDAEIGRGLREPVRGGDVGPARRRIAARMVVRNDKPGRLMVQRRPENLGHGQDDLVQLGHGMRVEGEHPPPAVQIEDGEPLPVQIGEERREQVGRIAGGGHDHPAFASAGRGAGTNQVPFGHHFGLEPGAGTAIVGAMQPYLDLIRRILDDGVRQEDRTGTGNALGVRPPDALRSRARLPAADPKKLHIRSILIELLWFLRGDTNVGWLKDNKVGIWDEWADEAGELGPVYGKQWRRWEANDGREIDQIACLIETIKRDPGSRRQIVSAWNPGDLGRMALPPCHLLFQTYVADGRLSLQMYQRSADVFLGVPFNIASYALLTHMLAQQCGLARRFVWVGGDCHLYSNHLDQAREQLGRQPRPLPTLKLLRRPASIDDYRFEDFEISGYDPHPHIKAQVAV